MNEEVRNTVLALSLEYIVQRSEGQVVHSRYVYKIVPCED